MMIISRNSKFVNNLSLNERVIFTDYVLRTFGLSKKYKNHFAVKEANINIKKGDIYGFVGENGSGKTTIIRLITGLIFPTAGGYELFGVPNTSREIINARKKVGAIVETPSIYSNMSAYDNLKMQATILGVECNDDVINEILCEVGLGELFENKKHVGDFSLGMRQRIGIAMSLLGNPEFIILDEPMNGLDPQGIVEIRELILKLNREYNITFLISSHILTELALVATKYGIISHGHIVKEITAEQIKKEYGKITTIKSDDPNTLYKIISELYPDSELSFVSYGISIIGELDLNDLFSVLLRNNVKITSVNCDETSIEDYYLTLLGGGHGD